MNEHPLKIIVACGGTGGHVFPGLATAQVLRSQGHAVTVWFSGRAIENSTHHAWDGPIFKTGARPLAPRTILALPGALLRCWRELRRTRPNVLLAMGSYASLPPALAASLRRVPIVLHEANAVPGQAVDFLSRFAAITAVSFESTRTDLPERKTVCTGLPIRAGLTGQPPLPGYEPRPNTFTVLITGGSQGAHWVNEISCSALSRLARELPGLRVIHQSGTVDAAWLRGLYATAKVQADVQPFIRDMGRAYASADLVICRAGASTCFELCACGTPAFLIPLPTAVRDHQRLNAAAMVADGGALMGLQHSLTVDLLTDTLRTLAANPTRRAAMRRALLALAQPDAARRLAETVCSAARGKQPRT